jgi:HK97 family phage major capsid protein
MDIKEMVQSAKSLLNEEKSAIEAGDIELATEKNAEYKILKAKIDAVKELNEANAELDSIEVPEQEPIRPPFDTDDEKDEPNEDADDFNKGIHVMQYGEIKSAEKAVLKDLYGSDYMQKRYDQKRAFVKYLRHGDRHLSANDEKLLNQIIVLPETLHNEINKGVDLREIKVTLQEGVADLGGYTVPEDFRADLIKRLMGLTVVRGRARQVTTIRDAVEWPKLEGGNSRYTSAVRVTWVDEVPSSATVAQTNPMFGLYRIPVFTVMARTDLSRNLVEDSAFNLLQVVSQLFAEAMAIDEDERFLVGDGGGVPRGILGNRSGANQTPEDGIESVNSGNASALTADGLVDLVYGLHAQYRQNAVAVGARLTHRNVRKLKDGIGDYLWQRGLQAGEPPTLLGYPFLESEAIPAIAANNYPVIFGDLAGYMIVDRVGMSIERVEDTTTKGTNTVALFARRRLGGQVIEPWRFQGHKVSA